MKVFVIVAALSVACSAVKILSTDVDTAWKEFQAHFPIDAKSYDASGERKALFAKTHSVILEHNKKNHTYVMEHNRFSVMSDDEKKAYVSAAPPRIPPGVRFVSYKDSPMMRQCDPAGVDYRNHTCLQPVKNQGDCKGGSYAFSATTVVEFGKCILTGTQVALSEQQLIDCSPSEGCLEGWHYYAWAYLAKFGGQATSDSYPYTGVDGKCKYPKTGVKGAELSSQYEENYYSYGYYINIAARDTTTMMDLLSKKRLIGISIAVVDSFYSYKSGVYTEPACGTNILGYHNMAIVGYGTLKGVNYWIVRNSWGSGWGSAGYILFQRGSNLCRIEDFAATTTVIA